MEPPRDGVVHRGGRDQTMKPPQPGYDRAAITPGIVHFGVGGFHRAHQAAYLDALLAQGTAQDWGIVGIGTMPGDVAMRDALAS